MNLPNCTHYHIALSIKPEPMHPLYKFYGGTIEVDCATTIENQSSDLIDTVPFLLYRLLSVEQVCDASGEALAFTQDVVALQDRPRQQANAIQVFLDHPLPAGESTQIRLIYHGPVCGYPEVWPYVQDHVSEQYTLLRREVLWFPVVSSPIGDTWEGSFTFDLFVTVPKGNLVAVANGQTCEVDERSDSMCYEWYATRPDKSPKLTVACAPFRHMDIAPNVAMYYLPDDEIGAQIAAKAMNAIPRSLITWVTLFILVACTNAPTSADLSRPTKTSALTPAGEVHPTQQSPCPVTPYATERPPDSHTASFTETWYGNEALWAGLSPAYNGTWYAGPQGLKVLWYRAVAGKLTVEGKRLDASAPSLQADIPEGYGNSGYQASGLVFPAEGCWEVIGRVADQALRFVVSVHPAEENPIK